MNVPPLPVELYSQIVDHLDWPDLSNLLTVSLAFRHEAGRRLYPNITFEYETTREKLLLLTQLSQGGRLGDYVHTIEATNLSISSELDWTKKLAASYPVMPNLRFLSLPLTTDPLVIPLPTAPFRLFTFQVRPSTDTDATLKAIKLFLESQDSIEELLTLQNSLLPMSPNALPKLRIIQAYPEVLENILPGRDVTHLYLYAQQSGSRGENFEASKLKSLSIADIGTLSLFQAYLPALELLELGLPHADSIHTPLLSLPNLRILKFVTRRWESTAEEVVKVFKILPKLECLDSYRGGSGWPYEGAQTVRWTIEKSQPVSRRVGWEDNAWRNV